MKAWLKYLLLLGMFAVLSCNVHGNFSHSRVMRNEASITEIKKYLIRQGKSYVSTKDIQDARIRRKLKKLKVDECRVFPGEFTLGGTMRRDTIVELKTGSFWKYEETLLLVPDNDTIHKILESRNFEYYAPGIYHCWMPLPIS